MEKHRADGHGRHMGFMTFLIIIARASGFLGVLGIIVLSLVPGSARPHTRLPNDAEHFIAYCLTTLALAFGFRPLVFRVVLASGLTLLAGTMEVLQHFVPDHSLKCQRSARRFYPRYLQ